MEELAEARSVWIIKKKSLAIENEMKSTTELHLYFQFFLLPNEVFRLSFQLTLYFENNIYLYAFYIVCTCINNQKGDRKKSSFNEMVLSVEKVKHRQCDKSSTVDSSTNVIHQWLLCNVENFWMFFSSFSIFPIFFLPSNHMRNSSSIQKRMHNEKHTKNEWNEIDI